MTEFRKIFSLISCVFLTFLPAVYTASQKCTKDSLVDTRTKQEGNITFPLTTSNFSKKTCYVEIRSPFGERTELILVNVREESPNEPCFENSIEIQSKNIKINHVSNIKLCTSVGDRTKIVLTSTTIVLEYKAVFQNVVGEKNTESAVSVHYKILDIQNSTKVCRHVLTAEHGEFKTVGFPDRPQKGECEWVISNDEGKEISLKFKIKNATNLNCITNYIDVLEVKSGESRLLLRICKHSKSRTIKSSSKLRIRIKSSMNQGIGFWATYHVVNHHQVTHNTDKCKVKVVNEPFNFNSPRTLCQTWNLTAPPGQVAALSFFNVFLVSTDSASCKGNFLEVWDGKTSSKYCNVKKAPKLILSKGRKLVVTYHSMEKETFLFSFQASFTSISPSSYKTNCFVKNKELRFQCNNEQVIPCKWQCDGAMQCSDNSDESMCSDIEARWHKLQVFVIVMGSICASTVIFCVGLVCFRKCIIHDRSLSSRRGRRSTNTDQAPLTPNADLPSPPPCYFTDQGEESPASIIRGTYFFGDEFSQSGIHSASLFGIPPPRYRSTESVHQSTTETRSIWQRSLSSIPLVPTDTSRSSVIVSLPEEDPPNYESLTADKDEAIMSHNEALNIETTQGLACVHGNLASSSNECIADDNLAIGEEPETCANELSPNDVVIADDIGRMNSGAALNV
ncbi:uncharacterized protein LOC114532364 [Dendronephthya gigantea]|uniref:uncharacterized protein LOC114532364 n=1 Tax=Dendronephthya gigantea TaxID=151771 RepID=UPI00106CF6DC|nr:uncharacterized protein LOC114532364 [Dendronephthya gigantea]